MVSIGPKIQIQGEDSYRLSLRRIIQETKELDSEMDRLVSSFDKNTTALERSTRKHEEYAKQIEQSQKQNYKIAEGLDMATKKHQDAIRAYDEQAKKLADLEKEQKRIIATMDSLERAGSKGSATWNGLNQMLEKNKAEVAEAEKGLQKASDEVERSGRVLADWQTSANKAETELNNLRRAFDDTRPIKVWGEAAQEAGEKITNLGETMTKFVSVPLAGLATASVKAAAEFEDGMAKIYTIAMDSTEPMEKMRAEIVQLSNDTGFALDDLAEATYQTVSASVDATQATEFMTHAVKLARAGFTTTTKAVDILTTVMNSYGKETYDVEYLTDLLLKTQNDGKVVIDQLASSIGVIIPLAANYHVGIEQIAAAYATMTKQGVPAERATTFMRALFTELENKSKDVAEVLENETGKSFAQLMDSGASLADVLQILYNKMDKNSEAYQQLFKNVRSGQAAASLAADDFGILNTELDRMQNVAGLTDRALEQMETPALKAKRAVNQLKNSSVELGEAMIQRFTPQFEKGVNIVKDLTQKFNSLSDESMNILISGGALMTVLPPLVTLGGKLVTYVGALMAGTASLVPLVAGLAVAMVGAYTAAQIQAAEEQALIEAQWGMSEANKKNIEDLQNLTTAHDDFVASMQKEYTESLNNASAAGLLAQKYDELVDSNGNVKAGSEVLADTLLTQIATALGTTKDEVVKLIDENGKLSGSIQKTIEDYKLQAQAAVLQKQIEEAAYRAAEAERIHTEVTAELREASEKLGDSSQRLKDAKNAITDAEERGIPVTEEMYEELRIATEEAEAAHDSFWALRDAEQTSREEMEKASSEVDDYAGRLENLGKESSDTATQIEKDAGKAKTATENAANGAKTSLDNAASGTSTAGYNFVKGFADSINSYAYLATSAAGNMGANASRALKNKLQIKSPSRVTAEAGKYFVEGFENSIAAGMKDVAYLGEMLGMSAAKGLSMGSYLPEAYGNTYNNKTVTAPIAINLTVQGNVDDPNTFARNIADMLADELTKESEVFA